MENDAELDRLEEEAAYVLREAAGQFERPVILFSGGKDSITLAHLARRAFAPMASPFALVHIDTGHNFPETLEFRDAFARDMGVRLIVRLVQDSIDSGSATEEKGTRASRNAIQSITLMESLRELKIDCAIGGARRDEEKARAKERFFSHRDAAGRWEPRHQRPEVWRHFNGSKSAGDHFRVFPLSNWTELDIWSYICRRDVPVPSLYFSHERNVFERDGVLYSQSPYLRLENGEIVKKEKVRFRTVGTRPAPEPSALRHRRCRRCLKKCGVCESASGPAAQTTDDRKRRWKTANDRGISSVGLLRIATAGSVDDGKSTLIGRLLWETDSLLEDQVLSLREASARRGEDLQLALVMDGLRAEREQNITIDVAYRPFRTSRHRFILADSPGHVQYTRNMVTGASTADAVIVLVDAQRGLQIQSMRHLAICFLLRPPAIILAVNKMDLVGFSQSVFNELVSGLERFSRRFGGVKTTAIPISALVGDNVTSRSTNAPWYDGPSILELLDGLEPAAEEPVSTTLPVQNVLLGPDQARYYAGTVQGASIQVGQVLETPSGHRSPIKQIVSMGDTVEKAARGVPVAVRLGDEIDIARGDWLIDASGAKLRGRKVRAILFWLQEDPLRIGLSYDSDKALEPFRESHPDSGPTESGKRRVCPGRRSGTERHRVGGDRTRPRGPLEKIRRFSGIGELCARRPASSDVGRRADRRKAVRLQEQGSRGGHGVLANRPERRRKNHSRRGVHRTAHGSRHRVGASGRGRIALRTLLRPRIYARRTEREHSTHRRSGQAVRGSGPGDGLLLDLAPGGPSRAGAIDLERQLLRSLR